MFDPSKLRADTQNLTGLLLIKSADKETGPNYFVIAGVDTKKILSIARDVPQGLEEMVRRVETTTQGMLTGLEVNIGENMGFFVYGLGGCMNGPIDSHIMPHDDLDVYEADAMKNEAEFLERVKNVIIGYFEIYNSQQGEKRKTKKVEARTTTVFETPAKNVAPRLYKLSARLLRAISDRNPLAQLEAEDSLRAFAFGNAFRYSVEQMIQLASSIQPGRVELIGLQCRIIRALAVENYRCAKDLQSLYERMIPSPVFSGEKV